MRILITTATALVVAGTLVGCGLFGLGTERTLPEGEAWRTEAVAALEGTPGVTSTSVVVSDVDTGTGHEGPLIKGTLMIDGDAQPVVDDALLRLSEVLGEGTNGVMIRLAVSVDGGPAQKMRDFGHDRVGNGADLWESTH